MFHSSFLVVIGACTATAAFAGHELDARNLEDGVRLYGEHCAFCHGTSLEGDPDWQTVNADGTYPAPPHNEEGHTWHHSNVENFQYVKKGGEQIAEELGVTCFKSGMPAFGETMTDAEIWDVLASIRDNWPERERRAQETRNPSHE